MSDAEKLRNPINVLMPDPRMKGITMDNLHTQLSHINLNPNIPEGISIQFETAKNLFLYSWFVYRFHHVADLQAIATLELALKTRFDELKIEYWHTAGLWKYLEKASENKLITAEDLPGYFEFAKHKAQHRYLRNNIRRMIEENLKELEYDYSKVLPETEDFNPNHLSDTFNNLAAARNALAHGTTSLFTPNINILVLTKALINALYKNA